MQYGVILEDMSVVPLSNWRFFLGGTYSSDYNACARLWGNWVNAYTNILAWEGDLDGRWKKGSLWENVGFIQRQIKHLIRKKMVGSSTLVIGGFSHGGNLALAILDQLYKSMPAAMRALRRVGVICAATPQLLEYECIYAATRERSVTHDLEILSIRAKDDPVINVALCLDPGSDKGLPTQHLTTGVTGIRAHDGLLSTPQAKEIIDAFLLRVEESRVKDRHGLPSTPEGGDPAIAEALISSKGM